MRRLSTDELNIDCHTDSPGFLWISQIFYPGWRATLNGKSVKIFAAHGLFQAVHLPSPGGNQIRLTYAPKRLYVGFLLAGLATLTACLMGRPWITTNLPTLTRLLTGPHNPAMHRVILRHAKKIAIIVIGATLCLFGFAMLVTPGPGILVILAGISILAIEFAWAKRLLREVKQRTQGLWPGKARPKQPEPPIES
jgi:hypothetical protein